jgi:hypothetical protein
MQIDAYRDDRRTTRIALPEPIMHARQAAQTMSRRPPTEAERELETYNAAFEELEVDWRWDLRILHELAGYATEKDRISAYLRHHRPHLLKVYDADALAHEIAEIRNRLRGRPSWRGND